MRCHAPVLARPPPSLLTSRTTGSSIDRLHAFFCLAESSGHLPCRGRRWRRCEGALSMQSSCGVVLLGRMRVPSHLWLLHDCRSDLPVQPALDEKGRARMIRCQGAHVPDVRARPDQREAGPPRRRAAARDAASSRRQDRDGLPRLPAVGRGQPCPLAHPARTGDHERCQQSEKGHADVTSVGLPAPAGLRRYPRGPRPLVQRCRWPRRDP